ncbi:MAG: hypothetical protein CMF52_05060 [Legionellales bacterium]|nr:hypothetical protein [Legionellales bacterium]HAV93823.1 hypothetical protein [Pseudomonadota bacterium]
MKICIDAKNALGDGLILAMFSRALAKSGHEVILLSKSLSKLSQFFHDVQILAYGDQKVKSVLQETDLIIALMKPSFSEYEEKTVSFTYVEHFKWARKKPLHSSLKMFSALDGVCLSKKYPSRDFADIFQLILNETVGGTLERHTGLECPENWEFQRNKKRIIFNVSSSETAHGKSTRMWRHDNWMKLADRLTKDGYEIVWDIMESEKKFMPERLLKEYQVVSHDLPSTLRLHYESRMLIGLDSGAKWLASAAGIPTLNIYYRSLKWILCLSNESREILSKGFISFFWYRMKKAFNIAYRVTKDSKYISYPGPHQSPSVNKVYKEAHRLLADTEIGAQ